MYDPGGGSVSGDSFMEGVISEARSMLGTGTPAFGEEQVSPFDKFRIYFSFPLTQSYEGYLRRGLPSGLREISVPDAGDIERRREAAQEERERQIERLVTAAKAARLIGDDFLPSELDHVWQAAVNEAEASSTMGDLMSPWEVLEHWASDPRRARDFVDPAPSAPDLGDLPAEKRTVVRTHKRFEITDPQTARAVVNAGLRSFLGRKPQTAEVRQFREYLAQLERNNPVVTKSISEYAGDELVSEEATVTGGAPSPSAAFQNFAEDEFSDEAYAYMIAQQGDELLRALVGSVV